jgi:hypothetical protein
LSEDSKVKVPSTNRESFSTTPTWDSALIHLPELFFFLLTIIPALENTAYTGEASGNNEDCNGCRIQITYSRVV